MIRPLLKKVFPQALVWLALVALCGAISLAQDNSAAPAAGVRTDGQIEMDVVHALDASKALKSDLITAATIQSDVTLSGTVSSEASRELAESIAAHVPGVTGVHNNLKVGNPQDAANAADAGAQPMAPDQTAQPDEPAQSMAPDAGPMPVPNQPQNQPQDQPQYQPQNQPQYPPQSPRQQAGRPRYAQRPPQAPQYDEPRGPVTVAGAGTAASAASPGPGV